MRKKLLQLFYSRIRRLQNVFSKVELKQKLLHTYQVSAISGFVKRVEIQADYLA